MEKAEGAVAMALPVVEVEAVVVALAVAEVAGGIGGGGSAVSGSDGNRNAKGKGPSGRFSQQLENRPPAAAPKWKKPYVCAFQEMRKLQHTTKLCILKYQMAR